MELNGKITSDKILKLKFSSSGKLAQLNVSSGQTVKKGQLLARLDQTELQAYLDRSLKYYEQVRADFDEKQKGNLNEYDKRKVQAELEVSIKNTEIAKTNLEATNLYSPVDGIIAEVDPIAVGVNITPAGFLITILDHQSFYFQAEVKEEDLGKVKPDLSAKISLKAFPQKALEGKITGIGYLPLKDGVYPVNFSLNDLSELKPGMTGKAVIND